MNSLRTAAGGATYGVGTACGPDTAAYSYPTGTVLFRVANGVVTLVDNPLTQRGTAINQVVAGPGGRIALVHDHGVVWQRDDATWRTYGEYAFADGATPYGRAWWAADGTLWLLVSLGNGFQLAAVHIALP